MVPAAGRGESRPDFIPGESGFAVCTGWCPEKALSRDVPEDRTLNIFTGMLISFPEFSLVAGLVFFGVSEVFSLMVFGVWGENFSAPEVISPLMVARIAGLVFFGVSEVFRPMVSGVWGENFSVTEIIPPVLIARVAEVVFSRPGEAERAAVDSCRELVLNSEPADLTLVFRITGALRFIEPEVIVTGFSASGATVLVPGFFSSFDPFSAMWWGVSNADLPVGGAGESATDKDIVDPSGVTAALGSFRSASVETRGVVSV